MVGVWEVPNCAIWTTSAKRRKANFLNFLTRLGAHESESIQRLFRVNPENPGRQQFKAGDRLKPCRLEQLVLAKRFFSPWQKTTEKLETSLIFLTKKSDLKNLFRRFSEVLWFLVVFCSKFFSEVDKTEAKATANTNCCCHWV